MSFRALFDHVQGISLHVKRNDIRDKIVELTGVDKIAFVRSGLDTSICRGYWITPQNRDHPSVMMHLFDTEEQKVRGAEAMNKLLAEFLSSSSPKVPFSPQFASEIDSFWQALAVLCPQTFRERFRKELDQGKTDHYGIALKLRIPEAYVPRLFEDRFDEWLSSKGCI
ncbi:MAG: hypothetical protein GDA52_01505 [Rhodobacteraceae bacterium]|nr:hypothetical protein [Paracoccaceae bacterium]